MGKWSTERCTCRVLLSVTNAFVEIIKRSIKEAEVGEKISGKTWGCATLVEEHWHINSGVMGAVKRTMSNFLGGFVQFLAPPVVLAANASYTHIQIEYVIDVDMYHLVKTKLIHGPNMLVNRCVATTRANKLAANVLKRFKRLRRRLVYKEMQREIRSEFKRQIAREAGFFAGISDAAITLKSVRVTTL